MERIPESEAIAEPLQAEQFNEHMKKSLVQHEYRHLAKRAARLDLPQGAGVLDVGTGPGYIAIETAHLLRSRAHITGLDLSAAMLTIADSNAQERGLSEFITWKEGDAKQMPFNDDTFDAVTSSGSLHHWDDPKRVFNEIARVLKPGGAVLIRDSRRLQKRSARLFAGMIGLSIPKTFRIHYWNSIKASYTPEELSDILQSSTLKNWHIEQDVMDLMVVVGA